MIAKFAEKGKAEDLELFETVINEVSTAAIKYALVSMSCRSKVIVHFIVLSSVDQLQYQESLRL